MLKYILSLLNPSLQTKKEEAEKAIQFISASKEKLESLSRNERTHKIRQLQFLRDHKDKLFEAFDILSVNSPTNAIKELLKLEKIITPDALPFFWVEAVTLIDKQLKQSSGETKKSIYMHIIKSAHKGYISDFIINHIDDIGIMISSPNVRHNHGFLETLLSQTAPRTTEFLEILQPKLSEIYETTPHNRHSLIHRLWNASTLSHGTNQEAKPPFYIANMRIRQIQTLVTQIGDLYQNGDKGFKAIASCLQDLIVLKAYDTPLLSQVKSDRNDGCHSFYYLFKLNTGENNPLYILAHKEKARGVPDEGGKLSIALIHPDIETISLAFTAINNDKASQVTVKGLVKHYTPDPSIVNPIDYGPTTSALTPSFELTVRDKGLDLTDAQFSPTQDRNLFTVQHDRPPEVH